jgi:hypothetical protein
MVWHLFQVILFSTIMSSAGCIVDHMFLMYFSIKYSLSNCIYPPKCLPLSVTPYPCSGIVFHNRCNQYFVQFKYVLLDIFFFARVSLNYSNKSTKVSLIFFKHFQSDSSHRDLFTEYDCLNSRILLCWFNMAKLFGWTESFLRFRRDGVSISYTVICLSHFDVCLAIT